MKAVVHEALGHIQGGHLVVFLVLVGEDALVHAGAVKGQVEEVLEALFDVVGVEHRQLAGLLQEGPHAEDIAVCPDQDAEVAVEGMHLADALGVVFIPGVGLAALDYPRYGQEGAQGFGDTHGPGPRPAAPVGGGEGLVQVEVQHVHPDIAHIDDAHDGVHVGPVAVDQAALGVHHCGHLLDVVFEKTQGVGVGDHDAGGVFVHEGVHQLRGQDAVLPRGQRHGLEAAQGGAGRVGAVGRVGDEHLVARFALGLVVGREDQHAGQLTLGPGGRLHRDGPQTGDMRQVVLQLVDQLERALAEARWAPAGGRRRGPAGPPGAR